MTGRTRKYSKKRKNQVVDDTEPEFLGTTEIQKDDTSTRPEAIPQTTAAETVQESQAELEEELEGDQDRDQDGPAAASERATDSVQPRIKRHRGPTKMKDIARDPNSRIRVDWNEFGAPCGDGSVKLSSYVGSLVREHVPILIDDWRKIGKQRETVLWKSVQARFELDTTYEESTVMKQMGCIWRSYKSRVVKEIMEAPNNAERMKLRPKNIPIIEWRKFIKRKTSKEFQAISDKYKELRSLQIPHTCSRKGMARLAEDMKKESPEPSDVTRLKVWVKSRTKNDGTPVNTNAAEKIRKADELVQSGTQPSTEANPREDILSKILGPDNPGRLRAMGRGMSASKLACFQMKNKHMTEMQINQVQLQQQVFELQEALARMNNPRPEPEVGENSAPRHFVECKQEITTEVYIV